MSAGVRARLGGRLGGLVIIWLIAVGWFALDMFSKAWALRTLPSGEWEVISGILYFNLVRNPGAAFGLLPAGRPLFIAMTVLMIGVGFVAPVILDIKRSWTAYAGFGLLVGGGMGNLFDRIFRDGLVVDFIDFRFWPIFNVADIGIVAGTAVVLLYLLVYLIRNEEARR